jgi:hypothetical protein
MPDDTTLKSVFDHAKAPPTGGGEFPDKPTVFATYVEHAADLHPDGGSTTADRVWYANGRLKLSADQKTLTGDMKVWSNHYYPGGPTFDDPPSVIPDDQFAEDGANRMVRISVSDTGQVTRRHRVGTGPWTTPLPLSATFDSAIYVEKTAGRMRSLSFTLGSITLS